MMISPTNWSPWIGSCLISTSLILSAFAANAQDGWRDMAGTSVPESSSVKSVEGFGGLLMVTSDMDWQEKWNTPPETVPNFNTTNEVEPGGELFILSFLSNPQVDASGMVNVTCDFAVSRPDGSKSVDEQDLPCFITRLRSDPRSVYLSTSWLKYVSEPSDPRGTWQVDVTLRDNFRGVEVPLQTSFVVK